MVISYRDAFISVVYVGAVFPPGDCWFRMTTRWLALQYGGLTHCHHNIHWVLSEVIAQNWKTHTHNVAENSVEWNLIMVGHDWKNGTIFSLIIGAVEKGCIYFNKEKTQLCRR